MKRISGHVVLFIREVRVLALWSGEQLRPNLQKGCQQILENANIQTVYVFFSYNKQNRDEWETLQIKCQIGDLVFMAHLQFTLVIYST